MVRRRQAIFHGSSPLAGVGTAFALSPRQMTLVRNNRRRRGFTLLELMIVVVIIGILAGLAVYGVGKYIAASKSHEATQMLGAIKSAQENYRAETHQYKHVSDNGWYPDDPGEYKSHWLSTHADKDAWQTLGVHSAGPVLFGYQTRAGTTGAPYVVPGVTKIFTYPASNEPWYVAAAQGNLDGDLVFQYYVTSSFTNEIYQENEGE